MTMRTVEGTQVASQIAADHAHARRPRRLTARRREEEAPTRRLSRSPEQRRGDRSNRESRKPRRTSVKRAKLPMIPMCGHAWHCSAHTGLHPIRDVRNPGRCPRCSTQVAGLDLRRVRGRDSPQGGKNIAAQGIALGLWRAMTRSPERAKRTLPRCGMSDPQLYRPFPDVHRGSYVIGFRFPGRRPGLACCCPFGATGDRIQGVDRKRGEDRSQASYAKTTRGNAPEIGRMEDPGSPDAHRGKGRNNR